MAGALVAVGLVANVARIADFSSKVLNRLINLQSDFEEIPESFHHIITELSVLIEALQQTNRVIEGGSVSDKVKIGLLPAVEECREQVDALDRLLTEILPLTSDSRGRNLYGVLSLPQEKEITTIIKILHDRTGILSFYHTTALSTLRTQKDPQLTKILRWLSPADPVLNYQKALKLRKTNTGRWLVESNSYTEWKKGKSCLIWLFGIPGCGKTILSSTVIENVLEHSIDDPGKVVVYFYFDYKDSEMQKTEAMIRSLICQFLPYCTKIPSSLETLFSTSNEGQRYPLLKSLLGVLYQIIEDFPRSYIVLDALDECTDQPELMDILEQIVGWHFDKIHILVTSRKEQNIESSLQTIIPQENMICLQHGVIDRDIQAYIQQRLDNDKGLQKWQKDLHVRQEIETKLMRGACGMFRWVACQLDSLTKCLNHKMLRKALSNLPPTLDATYERILCSIEPHYAEYALYIFQWVTFSARPLLVDEIAHALAINIDRSPAFDRNDILEHPLDVLRVCSSLISIPISQEDFEPRDGVDSESKAALLAHGSVEEYLTSERIHHGPAAQYSMQKSTCNALIAERCIRYLLQFDKAGSLTPKRLQESKLIRYSAEFWMWHAQMATPTTERLNKLAIEFYSRSEAYQNWFRVYNPDEPLSDPDIHRNLNTIPAPLYYASKNRLAEITTLLLNNGADVNEQGGCYGNALQVASLEGHDKIVDLLLSRGADVNKQGGYYGNALQAASFKGHDKSIELLLSYGADINTQGGYYGNAIQAASFEGHEKVVELLLNEGANINAQSGYYGNPLQVASYKGHQTVVQLLLNKGAKINAHGGHYGTALQAASALGHRVVVRLLLANGADIRARSRHYSTALEAASTNGHHKVVQLLLLHETDVNVQRKHSGAALQPAALDSDNNTLQLWESQTGNTTSAKNEARWEEDSDNFSDLSEVSSIQSLPSLMSDSSSMSMRDKYGSKAAEHLATLLSENSALSSMYEKAINKFGRERFHKNHDELLRAFFKDLRSETKGSIQLATVRGLRSRDRRHEITTLIYNAFEPLNSNRQQAMTILKDQKPNRKQLLNQYLGEMPSAWELNSIADCGNELEHSNVVPLEQDDESVNEEISSNGSDNNNDQSLDQDNKGRYTYLEPLDNFIMRGEAFAILKSSLSYLLQPPINLSEALNSRNLGIVQHFLRRNFASAATSNYEWLHELKEAGYSEREIAKLLIEDTNDCPWIYFTPQVHVRDHFQTKFHVPGCAHQPDFSTNPEPSTYSEQIRPRAPPLHNAVRRQVEELCGIGGVVPSSKNRSTWHGSVTFAEQSSVSLITYAASSVLTGQSRNDLMLRISSVLSNFCTAVAAVQSAELCCNVFTFLLNNQDCLELRRIELHRVAEMAFLMNVALQGSNIEAAVQECTQVAKYILKELKATISESMLDSNLHLCAIATQFLCAAFLSYTQAHVGLFDPFFLDTPQRKIILLGSQHTPGNFTITAELTELTCLAKMTKQPVLAFSSGSAGTDTRFENRIRRHDVVTNVEDCLDTWGPGYLIHNKADPSKIHAIGIAGGFISLVDSKTSRFHWAKMPMSENILLASFEPNRTIRIGTAIRINETCCIDETACRESSFCALEPLGTQRAFWEIQERQAGFQVGQYFTGTYSQTWKKIPGTTLKQYYLHQRDEALIHFLDQSWGLQVSFCTSVAHRVSLRELVTDLLPIFVNPLDQDTWQDLVNSHRIIHSFAQEDLFAWLRTLPLLLQRYVLTLVRTILEHLQHTGLDRRNDTLIIAWPQEGDIDRGLKIPCKAQTYWAQVIEDAEDCATFAYVTPKCLETNHVRCRGNLRAWQNVSKILVTEMSPSWPVGQPVTATSSPTITASPAPLATTTTTTTSTAVATPVNQWELEDKKIYYVQKLERLLRFRVERPSSTNNDVAHLVMTSSNIRPGMWKRLLVRGEEGRSHRIRERQAIGDRAECVVVRAGLIGA